MKFYIKYKLQNMVYNLHASSKKGYKFILAKANSKKLEYYNIKKTEDFCSGKLIKHQCLSNTTIIIVF